MILRRPKPTLFPYTTLFRSRKRLEALRHGARRADIVQKVRNPLVQALQQGRRPPDNVVEYEGGRYRRGARSEEHTSELQSRENFVCRLLLEKKKLNA